MTLNLIINGHTVSADAVIFDKDGTINNSLKVMPEIAKSRVNQIKKYLPQAVKYENQMAQAIGLRGGKIDPDSPMMVGSRQETVNAAATVLYMATEIGWQQATEAIWKAFLEGDNDLSADQRVSLIEGAKKTIQEIFRLGGRISIATNDVKESTLSFLYHSGLDKYIHAVACSDEVRSGKPEPDLALLAADRMKIDIKQCILVGDSISDMEMGRRAGVKKSVGVLSGSADHKSLIGKADLIISSIAEMKCFNSLEA